MLCELEEFKVVDRRDGYVLMIDEVVFELVYLGNMCEKVI